VYLGHLIFYGLNKFSILDGGYLQWNIAGYKTNNIIPKLVVESSFIANLEPEKYTSQLNMRLAINNKSHFIIDSRASSEYLGKKSITNKLRRIANLNSILWGENI